MEQGLEALERLGKRLYLTDGEHNRSRGMFNPAYAVDDYKIVHETILHYKELKEVKLPSYKTSLKRCQDMYHDKCLEIGRLKNKIKHIQKTLDDMMKKVLGDTND
mgnify:CR=1 FL=1